MTRTQPLTTMVASQRHHNGGQSLTVDPFSTSLSSPDSAVFSSDEAAYQELRGRVKKLRAAPSDANHVDVALKEYTRLKDRSMSLCEALLRPRSHRPRSLLSPMSTTDGARTPSFETSSLGTFETRTSRSSRSSAGYGTLSSYVFEQHLDVIRDWVDCLEDLCTTYRDSLVDTYRQWEPESSPAMVEQLFRDKKFRSNAIQRMRNASISKTVSANLDFFPKYDIRFRDYDKLVADISDVRSLLQAGESGISPDRTIEEIIISQRGDAVLEFANKDSEANPVFRFRVSSHMLAETSPIFALMFNHAVPREVVDVEAASNLPPTPSRYICKDGSEVVLFRMPQTELNVEKSFEILLHAAHMHNDVVPRDIAFDQFIAIAEACMRYQCTSPLELSVEYRWLPQWVHKATEDMPDGLLLISYAFGLRRLFTRMSKTAILNIADEKDLQSKSWPQKIKDKVWAVRTAKIDQVYACCNNALQEYLRCPIATTAPAPDTSNVLNTPGLAPTSSPRCPKGSHFCDAASLGWLMMLFNELHILPHIMRPATPSHHAPGPKRSLNQILDSLRFMASPPQAHRGVCDFAPAFRTAMNDIYNSVSGLTLFEISGKHGWALSKHKSVLPQAVFKIGAPLPDAELAKRAREEVALTIMGHLDNLEDVYNAALINKSFFAAFKNNELAVMKGLIKKTSKLPTQRWTVEGATNKRQARAEMKALRGEKARLKKNITDNNSSDVVDGNDAYDGMAAGGRSVAELQSAFDEDSEGDDDGGDAESESLIVADDSRLPSPPELGEAQVEMTREEAERILWPDRSDEAGLSPPRLPQPSPQSQGDDRAPVGRAREQSEKFRAGDLIFTTVEEKILVIGENKYLREEHDRELKERDGHDTMDVWI